MEMRGWFGQVRPFALMVAMEFTDVLLSTLSKEAMSRGMSRYVHVVYYNAFGTVILFPHFIFNREKRPPLTFRLLSRCLLLGLIGISLRQIFLFIGDRFSSSTLSSAMKNLIPAITLVVLLVFRFSKEKINISSSSFQATYLGTIVLISGANMITFYKGPPIIIIQSPSNLHDHHLLLSSQSNWVLGGLLLLVTPFLAALRKIVLASITEELPSEELSSELTIVFFHCLFETILGAILCLIEVRNPSAWRLKPDIELITIVCLALFRSVFHNSIHTWGVHKKGPLYVTMFRPLSSIFEVFVGVTFLGDNLHVGSVVGVILIALGFYAVFWGKPKDEKMGEEDSGVSNMEPNLTDCFLPSQDEEQ